jgi:hypothetical protein
VRRRPPVPVADVARRYTLAVLIVGFLAFQPALKFFVSTAFGPLKDVVVVGIVLAYVGSAAWRRVGGARGAGPDHWLLGGIALIAVLYVVNPAGTYGAAWMDATRIELEALLLLAVGLSTRDADDVLTATVNVLVAVCVAEALIGAVQHVIGGQQLILHYHYAYGAQVRDDPSGRLRSFGTFDEPFSYGTFLLLGAAAVLFGPRARWWNVFAVGAISVGVVLSWVKTSQVTLVVLLLAWALVNLRKTVTAAIAMASACALPLAVVYLTRKKPTLVSNGASVFNLNGRTKGWTRVVTHVSALALGNGVGVRGAGLQRSAAGGTIAAVQRYVPGKPPIISPLVGPGFVDSSYLSALSDTGLPGLVVLLAVMGRIALLIWRGYRAGSAWAPLGLAVVGVIVIDGFTRSSLTAFPLGYIALFIVGLLVRACCHHIGGATPALAAPLEPHLQDLAKAPRRVPVRIG